MPEHTNTADRRIRLRGDRFDAATTEAGLTSNTQIGDALGIDRTTVSRVRRGLTAPGEAFIAAAITHLGKPFEDLFEVTSDAA